MADPKEIPDATDSRVEDTTQPISPVEPEVDPLADTATIPSAVVAQIAAAFEGEGITSANTIRRVDTLVGMAPPNPIVIDMVNTDVASLFEGTRNTGVEALIGKAGWLLDAQDFSALTGVPVDVLARHHLIRIHGKYPAFQAYQGTLLAGVRQVVSALCLAGHDVTMILRFFTEENPALKEVSPIERLRTAHSLALHAGTDPQQSDGIKAVLATVNQYPEHGSK